MSWLETDLDRHFDFLSVASLLLLVQIVPWGETLTTSMHVCCKCCKQNFHMLVLLRSSGRLTARRLLPRRCNLLSASLGLHCSQHVGIAWHCRAECHVDRPVSSRAVEKALQSFEKRDVDTFGETKLPLLLAEYRKKLYLREKFQLRAPL